MKRRGSRAGASTVRVIAGRWRGRRLPVGGSEVRPTPDRIRETLFNWLQPVISCAHVLDLFAGTAALGIESLSRGASSAVFVDRDPVAARVISDVLKELGADSASVVQQDAARYLRSPANSFNIVFLDPPFAGSDLANLCKLLEHSGALEPGGWVYLETSRLNALPELPENWALVREETAGQVRFGLARREG